VAMDCLPRKGQLDTLEFVPSPTCGRGSPAGAGEGALAGKSTLSLTLSHQWEREQTKACSALFAGQKSVARRDTFRPCARLGFKGMKLKRKQFYFGTLEFLDEGGAGRATPETVVFGALLEPPPPPLLGPSDPNDPLL
jgi:hypothetical protein